MTNIQRLLLIMRRLRAPRGGCDWDLQQTYKTIVPHTLEEAYEVAEAVETEDMAALLDELGDLLFQVVFYSQLAEEENKFCFADVVDAICTKLERRHPRIFGDPELAGAGAGDTWEQIKAVERRAAKGKSQGCLSGVSVALPAVTRAIKLQQRAASAGFDWTEWQPVLQAVSAELKELTDALSSEVDAVQTERIDEEFGDVLFTCINLARHLHVDPEGALRRANRKFERRFRLMEQFCNETGTSIEQLSLDELDSLWIRAKQTIARENDERAEGKPY